jgi:protein-disulfide isomerase
MSSYDQPVSASGASLEAGVDHVRGPGDAPVVLEYGDYECPYSRLASREIERVERAIEGGVRFAYRHYPLVQIHPRALAVVHRGDYDTMSLIEAINARRT